jgi:hypothetical protein
MTWLMLKRLTRASSQLFTITKLREAAETLFMYSL